MARFEIAVTEQTPAKIAWNYEELSAQLDEALKTYNNRVYTEAEIAEAKADRARLNNLDKAIGDSVKEVYRDICGSYADFEAQAKTLRAKVKQASGAIDAQVKAQEQRDKDAKRAQILDYFAQADFKGLNVDISAVWNDKWLNKTYTEKAWKADIDAAAERARADIERMIQTGSGEQFSVMSESYKKDLDFGKALAAWDSYCRQKQAAEERQRQFEEARKVREAREAERARLAAERAAQPQPIIYEPTPVTPPDVQIAPEVAAQPEKEERLVRLLRIKATKAQIYALANFMRNNGIEFEKVTE